MGTIHVNTDLMRNWARSSSNSTTKSKTRSSHKFRAPLISLKAIGRVSAASATSSCTRNGVQPRRTSCKPAKILVDTCKTLPHASSRWISPKSSPKAAHPPGPPNSYQRQPNGKDDRKDRAFHFHLTYLHIPASLFTLMQFSQHLLSVFAQRRHSSHIWIYPLQVVRGEQCWNHAIG
jgi:hypothetical protein